MLARDAAFIALIVACLLIPSPRPVRAQTSGDLDFLANLPDFEHIREMLPDYLNRIGNELLDQRERTVAQISSAEDVARRKTYVRERVLRALGGLPERTPLNTRVVGVLERPGYRIEKVIFESQSKFYVPGNLYLPTTGHPPYPGVLFPLGHENPGKTNSDWQHVLVSLARRGFVAFTWDTLGQGERLQFYDPDFEVSKFGATGFTTEHTMIGAQCLLAGDSLARYTIWDGMRALDYLLSRKEVDPTRIACTGNSGGGTHTAYLSALDDRIAVAAPSCYITSWRRLLESIGPQDAEQCLPPFLRDGLDHADFIYAFAPKPYLILSAIRDFFSISGARASFKDASAVYSVLGASRKLRMFDSDDTHGYRLPRRLAAYNWLSLWLNGREDHAPEQEVKLEPDEALHCTATGQVSTSLGGETVFSLNTQRVDQAKSQRVSFAAGQSGAGYRAELEKRVRRLTAFDPRRDALSVSPFGTVNAQGYVMEKIVYDSEPGIRIPAVLLIPARGTAPKPAVIYLDAGGKSAGWGREGEIQPLLERGFIVLAIDARGWGETRPFRNPDEDSATYRFFGDYPSAMRAFLIGKTLVGMRAEDVFRGVDYLASRPEVDKQRIYGFGSSAGAMVLLHEAVLDRRIKQLALEHLLVSYESATTHRTHHDLYESIVPGVLKAYDVPDLLAALAPRPVWVLDAVDPMGRKVRIDEARGEYARSIAAFKQSGAEASIHIAVRSPEEGLNDIY